MWHLEDEAVQPGGDEKRNDYEEPLQFTIR